MPAPSPATRFLLSMAFLVLQRISQEKTSSGPQPPKSLAYAAVKRSQNFIWKIRVPHFSRSLREVGLFDVAGTVLLKISYRPQKKIGLSLGAPRAASMGNLAAAGHRPLRKNRLPH